MKRLKTGNQMIAEGAVRSGCRFFAGYPITPASGIYKGMIDLLQQRGDLAVSAPDEISALAYCVGASLRGFKSMTATSGPGWALMIETVQYALMTETPVVIALVQRLGPSTGGATQGAQGDILLAEFCTSGGYTIPILCPSTAAECYTLTMRAFSWAESLRSPVVLLTDKEVAMTSEVVDWDQLEEVEVVDRAGFPADGPSTNHPTYGFVNPPDIPAFASVGGNIKVTVTGSAHNMNGLLKKNDPETLLVLHHLEEKIQHRQSDLSIVKQAGHPDPEVVVISYGVTARAAAEAVDLATTSGIRAALLQVQSLFPIPVQALRETTQGVRRVIVAEENLPGQYRSVIQPYIRSREILGVNKIGSMITPGEIIDAMSRT